MLTLILSRKWQFIYIFIFCCSFSHVLKFPGIRRLTVEKNRLTKKKEKL